MRRYSTQPQRNLQLYYNRLFIPSGPLLKFVPSFLIRPSYERLKEEIQASIGADNGTVKEVIPRPAEGGAFAKISTENPNYVKALAQKGLNRRWLLLNHRSRGYEVVGKPWITDIPRSISRIVKVDPPLPDEDCYELLRPYGRIIKLNNGNVVFSNVQDAVTASFCAHRVNVDFKEVRLSLVQRASIWARVRGWLTSHPRVVIPAIVALLFAIAYAVFEPVRELSISAKIRGTLAMVYRYVEQARNSGQQLIWSFKKSGDNEESKKWNNILTEEQDTSNKLLQNARTLRTFIEEGVPTFTVVVGPKGSGKDEAIEIALEDIPLILSIDCERLRNGSDDQMLRGLAHSVGYWPLFLWTNNVFKAAEVGIQGITGQTTGITETTDEQVRRILTTTSKAIRKLALRNVNTNDETTYLETHPDQLPVIVLRGFAGSDRVSELLAEWAGELTKKQLARVVIVAQDASSFDKTLSNALPNRVFRVVRVEDVAPRAAKDHVLRLFAGLATTPEAKQSLKEFSQLGADFLEPLGGRFTDLQSFGRRLLNGESPQAALDSLVHSAALEVSQLFLNTEQHGEWSVEQSWELVSLLSQSSSSQAWLSVPGVLATNPLVSSADAATLEALERGGMITLRSVAGRITGIKASRPLFRAAFRRLVDDPLVSNVMASRVAKACMKLQTAKIKDAEAELSTLANLSNTREIKERHDYIVKLLADAQGKLLKYQSDLSKATAVLQQFKWYEPSNNTMNNSNGSKWFHSESLASSFS